MIKEQIVAYVTALINMHSRISESTKKINPFVARYDEIFKDELTELLDFIEDIPEVKTVSEDTEELELRLKYVKDERNELRSKITELEKQLKVKSDLEQYAEFIKAIRAYGNGKVIKCEFNGTNIYKKSGKGLIDAFGSAVSHYEILNGKWSIQREEEQE